MSRPSGALGRREPPPPRRCTGSRTRLIATDAYAGHPGEILELRRAREPPEGLGADRGRVDAPSGYAGEHHAGTTGHAGGVPPVSLRQQEHAARRRGGCSVTGDGGSRRGRGPPTTRAQHEHMGSRSPRKKGTLRGRRAGASTASARRGPRRSRTVDARGCVPKDKRLTRGARKGVTRWRSARLMGWTRQLGGGGGCAAHGTLIRCCSTDVSIALGSGHGFMLPVYRRAVHGPAAAS